ALLETLGEAVSAEPNLTRLTGSVEAIALSAEQADITLAGGESLSCAFVIGADGRQSLVRESAGIGTRRWSYPQSALVLNFTHSIPHGNTSTEFHTQTGPFTQVPLPGD